MVRAAFLLAGLALAAVFSAGAAAVGTATVRWIAPGRRFSVPVRLALGLVVYALVGCLLGLVGLLRVPVVATLALLPGAVAASRCFRSGRGTLEPVRALVASLGSEAWLALPTVPIAAAYLAAWTLPTFHHDVVSNYVGVPAAYLVRGGAWPLEWNVFSAASFLLHGLVVFPLSLDAVLPEGELLFGWGSVWGGFHLLAVLGCAWAGADLVGRLTADRVAGRRAGWLGVLLWLVIPQTLLLAGLELVEFVTTFVALALARLVADEGGRRGAAAGLVAGLLAGFLVAAKPQLGAFSAVALALLLAGERSRRTLSGAAAGCTLALLPQVVRNWIAYGAPLFPWLGGSGSARAAADDWLSINAVGLPSGPFELGERVVRTLTVHPEAGFAAAVTVAVLAARPVRRWPWALAVVPLVATAAASDAAYHVLRWSQASLVLLMGLAGMGLVGLLGHRRWGRAAITVALLAGLVPAVRFVCATIGGCSQLGWAPSAAVASHIPSLAARAALAALPERVLYLGELDGFYGVENGILPSPHDGRAVLARYAAREPETIRRRLADDGIGILAVDRAFDGILGPRAPWAELGPSERAALGRLLATLEPVAVPAPVHAYRLGPAQTRPSPGTLRH